MERGQRAFVGACARCHVEDLSGKNGPALKGDRFDALILCGSPNIYSHGSGVTWGCGLIDDRGLAQYMVLPLDGEPTLIYPHPGCHIEAVRKQVLEPMAAKLAGLKMRMKRFFEVGEHLIAIGHYHGRSKATTKELEAASAHIWTFRNGKPVRSEAYHDEAKWLELAKETTKPDQRLAA